MDSEEEPLIRNPPNEQTNNNETKYQNGDVKPKKYDPVNFADASIETTVDANDGKEEEDFTFFQAPRSKKILLLSLGLVNFCAMACFSLLSPFYPKEATDKNVTQTVIGLVFGSFEFTIFLTSPIYGNFITKIGSKFMFISGIFVCGVCTILFGFLDAVPDETTFVVLCFLTRGVEALGASAYITASFAIISHAYPKHVSTVIGILETFSGVGMMVGPAIGSALYVIGGFGMPFFVLGGILIVCGMFVPLVMPKIEDKKQKLSKSIFHLLKSPLCLIICFVTVCGTVGMGFLEPVLADRLEELGLSTILIGIMFLINSATYAIGAPIWGWIGDTKGIIKSLIIFGNISTGFSYMLMGPAPFLTFYPFDVWAQILALVLMGVLCGAAIIPTYNALFIGATTQLGMEDDFETHGLISGLYNSCWSLGAFIGPMAAGALVQEFEFPWSCTACGGLFIFAGLVVLVYVIIERYTLLCPVKPQKAGYEKIIDETLCESAQV